MAGKFSKFNTRAGTRVGSVSSAPRKHTFGGLVDVIMICLHTTYFRSKTKPQPGEIIWCSKCENYKKVKE